MGIILIYFVNYFVKIKSYVDGGNGVMKSDDVNIVEMANVEK